MRSTLFYIPRFRSHASRFAGLLALIAFYVLLSACVPSPTATPPRQTPFPTLPLVEETNTPEGVTTPQDETPSVPQPTRAETVTAAPIAPTGAPVPTNAAFINDTLAPIVQLSVQSPGTPVSQGQTVPLNVYAADNFSIARLELYDNNVLAGQATVLVPSSVYLNQFNWQANVLGKHILRAVAYDFRGNASTPAQIEVDVINNNRAPEVQITDPSGHKDAEIGVPLLIQGVATDDVAVTRMELIVDNQLVTFVTPEHGAVTPFAVAILWTPTTTGSHNIVLRAYDNQNQSDDSLRYSVSVFDNQPPVVNAQSEYATLAPGDVLVVDALALANNGIARIQLYVDENLADTVNSNAPSRQTAFQVALSAPNLSVGNHSFFIRAYDVTGQSTDTPHGAIQVQEGASRIPRATPLSHPSETPLPPTPTATQQIVLPGPPTIDLALATVPAVLPNAAKIQITARGSSELDRIELWVRAPGETSAQLVTEENVRGATEKTLVYDWIPPRAGVIEMYARVYDILKQERVSTPLRFSVLPPPAPTSAPGDFNLAQAWYAESPASRYQVTFTQIGRALRGAFVETRTDGTVLNGSVVSGAVNDKNILFAVDFAPGGTNHTLQFDCTFNARPPVITCNYANENAERGSSVFQPLEP